MRPGCPTSDHDLAFKNVGGYPAGVRQVPAWKSTGIVAAGGTGTTRIVSLGEFPRELDMPVVQQANLPANPEAVFSSALGSVRSATLRKHLREAHRIESYSKATSDGAWPKHVGITLSHLKERRCEPCGASVPGAILQSLAFIERRGGLASSDRLSELPVVRNTVNQFTMDLRNGAPPERQAPALPIGSSCLRWFGWPLPARVCLL